MKIEQIREMKIEDITNEVNALQKELMNLRMGNKIGTVDNQLVRRISFRRAMKKAEENALRFGAKGIKIKVSGRLNGAEIARSEEYLSGQMPLQTLRANVDYGFAQALTNYGIIGVKVWVNKG